jgi:23S rRNA (guanosine2251-2'-O)-methyltransferase
VPELVAGRRWVIEALRAGRVQRLWVAAGGRGLGQVMAAAAAAGVPAETVPRPELDRMTPGLEHQGVAAAVRGRRPSALADLLRGADLLVAAAGIEDPHNLGAIARSAEAAGAQGMILPQRRSAGVTPAAERAAAGAFEHLPVATVANMRQALEACKRAGMWVCAADPGARDLAWEADLTGSLVVVIGGEGRGLPRLVRESCDIRVRLPMAGRVESLNASVAAGVLLYEIMRQRAAAARVRLRVDAPAEG